ncbi:hypothetical protein Nepgr_000748 [Nepenthes gracilis]|uniref:RING-type domain-containing protein n=1 Tax=Nepenthes gracilis TaxID=150966 RepID=A0AAD3RWF2_NEPGR|nr:hypothetical protein Nepgr_000748 [Nepenthes gracilis]
MDENSKADGVAKPAAGENPNGETIENADFSAIDVSGTGSNAAQSRQSSRTPFTDLNQVDADLALARTLQEQERAYMMLRMNGDGSDYGSWEAGSYYHDDDDEFGDLHDHEYDEFDDDVDDDDDDEEDDNDNEDGNDDIDGGEEDAFDVHAHGESGDSIAPSIEIDSASFPDDEAYARALQDAEERDMAARLLAMAGITEREVLELEDHGGNSQDTWEEVDPDELSYEELLALGEVVGTESRGLSADTIASLPSINYKSHNTQDGERDSCVICRLEYEDGDALIVLACKHSYHSECINNWLTINKVCPVCSVEVSTSTNS